MVLSLKKYSKDFIPENIKNDILNYKYSFNPSYVSTENKNYLAIRLLETESKKIIVKIYCWEDDKNFTNLNLSEYFLKHLNISKVADPKLFMMNNNVWCTFNTGYISDAYNKIGLFEITNEKIGLTYLCSYSKRARIEKNWAFFKKNEQLFCLYSLSPLKILKAKVYKDSVIDFEDFYENKLQDFKNYTIGTPLVEDADYFYFVSHRKFYYKGKRLYFGRPFKLSFKKKEPYVQKCKYLLFHSLKSLFGDKFKFNKNLISCTYFSGIQKVNDHMMLIYGINDVQWNSILIKKRKLWP